MALKVCSITGRHSLLENSRLMIAKAICDQDHDYGLV